PARSSPRRWRAEDGPQDSVRASLFYAVAGGFEAELQRGDLLRARGLERELDLRLSDRRVRRERPVVKDVQDVGPFLRDEGGEPRQGARDVAQQHPQTDQPSVLDEAALDDAREQGDVEVADRGH